MAYPIVWSGLVGSPYRFQVGAQLVSQLTAVDGWTTAAIKFDLFFNTPNTINYNGAAYNWVAWTTSGGNFASGSGTFNAVVSNGTIQIANDLTIEVPINGRTPLDWHFKVTIPSFYPSWSNGSPSVTADGYIPFTQPYSPTNAAVSRISDTSTSITWNQIQSNGARVENVVIRRVDVLSSAWKTIATIGYATSYTDNTCAAGNRYIYQILSKNRGFWSAASTTSPPISTTPKTATNVSAAKAANGTDIIVTWTNGSGAAAQSCITEVYDKPNGGTGVLLGTAAVGANTFTHLSPSSAQTHAYYVRHKTADNNPTLYGSNSAVSNTVALLAPPLAPTITGPSVLDPADLTPVTWNHNSVDTTAQTAYEVQHRAVGGSTWTSTGKITSAVSSWVTPGTWPLGQSREVQVRTYGAHASASPWSATAVIPTSARPTALITSPGASVSGAVVDVEWTYFDAESTVQSAAVVTLEDSTSTVIETINIDGAATTATFVTRVANAGSYTVKVDVRDGSGLWSTTVSQPFTVAYFPPASPAATVEWDAETGSAVLTISYVEPTGTEVATQTIEVWRGDVLVESLLAPSPGAPVAVIDPIPPLDGASYSIVAWSSSPSSATTDLELAADPIVSGTVYLNAGPGWSEVAYLIADLSFDVTAGRARTTEFYSGRSRPVETIGTAVDEQISISGVCLPGDDHRTFSRVQLAGTTVCMRWPEGREFVSLDAPKVSTSNQGAGHSVSLSGTVVDFKE